MGLNLALARPLSVAVGTLRPLALRGPPLAPRRAEGRGRSLIHRMRALGPLAAARSVALQLWAASDDVATRLESEVNRRVYIVQYKVSLALYTLLGLHSDALRMSLVTPPRGGDRQVNRRRAG